MEGKTCNSCGTFKEYEAFRRNASSPDGRRGTCTACLRLKSQLRRHGVIDKTCVRCKKRKEVALFHPHDETADGYSNVCKVCHHAGMSARRRAKNGFTTDAYAALVVAQDGKCAVCKVESNALAADHDHTTGATRGLLCNNCNLGIGNFRDDPELLASAIKYLMAYRRAVADYLEPEAQETMLTVVRSHIGG